MNFGIVSKMDDETTRVIFRSKKVPMQNVYYSAALGKLGENLKSGDVVHVVSCTRFASVHQVYAFAKFCFEQGVTLRFIAEPYLDIGNGKQWRPVVFNAVRSMMESEDNAKRRMLQGFKMTNEQWEYVFQCFEMMNLDIMSYMFSANGVLKRGV